jgi:hypothetical protein
LRPPANSLVPLGQRTLEGTGITIFGFDKPLMNAMQRETR